MGVFGVLNSIPLEFEIVVYSPDNPRKRVQKITNDGDLVFPDEGIGFGIPEEGISDMRNVTDSSGGVIVLSTHSNTGPLRIHRIYENGHVGGDTLVVIDDDYSPSNIDLSLSNYPNPFNSITIVTINSPTQMKISLSLYDIIGRKVTNIINANIQKGISRFNLNFSSYSDLSSGTYFLVLKTTENMITQKITYLK
jgi:hypothetical protein